MIIWGPKDPGDTRAYTDDLRQLLGADSIDTFTLTVASGTVTVVESDTADNVMTALIAGGADGETSVFTHHIETVDGQIIDRTITLYTATGADSLSPASTTKRMLIEQAFGECGINGWEYDITPEEKDKALNRLDALMWELRGRGIDIGYNFPVGIGQGGLDDELGCPDQAFYGLATLEAERLCPTMGKTQSKETRIALDSAMKAVRSAATVLVPSRRFSPGTAWGAGNKPWATRYPFVT